jgi:hypothetical protein
MSDSSTFNKTLAAWLVRIAAFTLLLLSGLDKFKSTNPPYSFAWENFYGKADDLKEGKAPKWSKIANVVFTNSGLDNADKVGTPIANLNSHIFMWYGKSLPFMFFFSGLLIFLGLFRNLGYFLGGVTFLSLMAGQTMLPDTEYMMYLLVFAAVNMVGLFLSQYDRLTLDGLFRVKSSE